MSLPSRRAALPRARAAKRLRASGLIAHFGKAAARLINLAWSPPEAVPARLPPRGRVVEVEHFGSNPGALRMLVFHPRRKPQAGAPLIVILHGCGQNGADFAAQTGWIAMAEQLGIPLVLPLQVTANHRNRCFNWYRPMDVGRGLGEAMSIRQMVRHASQEFGSDRRCVFIVGLTAGGGDGGGHAGGLSGRLCRRGRGRGHAGRCGQHLAHGVAAHASRGSLQHAHRARGRRARANRAARPPAVAPPLHLAGRERSHGGPGECRDPRGAMGRTPWPRG